MPWPRSHCSSRWSSARASGSPRSTEPPRATRSSTARRTRSRTSILQAAYDYGTATLEANVFEHLLDFRNGAKLEPSLATKCFSVGTSKTWRCTLRKGVTFHDGSAFDSADVKFSFDRVTNKTIVKQAAANSPSSLLGNLKS